MKAEEQRAAYTATQATIPTEWPIVPFEQVAIPQSDRGKRIKQRDYLPEGRIPVIDQGQTLIGGYTNDEGFAFLGELPVVLFGDHTRAVKLVDHRFVVGADGIKIFRPAEGVRPKYLYYWMKSARIPDRGYGRHYQYLRQLCVPLPPPNKQDEIVAEIEKQFSRLDEAVANLKRVKANLKRYRAAVLKAALEGHLVETEAELARREGRSYETGAQLLQRVLETRRSQWQGKGKYKEPAAPDITDLPGLPEGWVWACVNQIAEKVVDGTHHTPEYVTEGIAFISVKDVRDGTIHFGDTKFISPSEHLELIKRCNPEVGDVVITKSGTIGRTALIITDRPFSLFVSVALIKPVKPVVISKFLRIALDGYIQSIDIAQDVKGGLLKNLHLEDLRLVTIPIPPESEQHRIVAEVERRLSRADEAVAQATTNLKRSEGLRQSVLRRAFYTGT
jgi:type I restriction enzyme S subunit